jgi:hypothetical protein
MKLKNLTKKIRRLEARLLKDAKKLAKLKRKRGAATTAGAAKKAGKTVRASTQAKTKTRVQSAVAAQEPSGAKKVRRKLNLTPERRAQLAAAMKARWAAKRAAAATNSQASQPQ